MTSPIDHLTFTGAQILRDGAINTGDITVANGVISHDTGPQLDLSGYYILPGIIDLHGDAFEHHISPRPSAPFPIADGLAGTDRDAATNGITTAWLAQSWSWEGGKRGPDFAENLLAAHQAYMPNAGTDLRVQIRCETHTVTTADRLIDMIKRFNIDYVVFNNHLDEAIALAETSPARVANWAAQASRSVAEHMAIVTETKSMSHGVSAHLLRLSQVFQDLGLHCGSHDDGDRKTREDYAALGATICEFPTHADAAIAAKDAGHPVLMGAPNVVRGGSQSGNIAATTLIKDGLCDALVSDYHYPTLAKSAFTLVNDNMLSLADAWAFISSNPAQIMGLKDRGRLTGGQRADLVMINAETQTIDATMANGRWTYLTGDVAYRLSTGSC